MYSAPSSSVNPSSEIIVTILQVIRHAALGVCGGAYRKAEERQKVTLETGLSCYLVLWAINRMGSVKQRT